jgi:hypothetical protein
MLAESVKALIKLRRFIVRSPWTYEFFLRADANAESAFARGVPGRGKALKCGVGVGRGKRQCTTSDRIAGAGATWRSALGRGGGLIQGEISDRPTMLTLLPF